MSYQVIARKYRPQRFSEVVGQDHVTQTLRNAIEQKRIAHAYLFVGPRGTGKTTLARIFAKALNCANGPKADFDDQDPKCREIAEGRSLDVLEIDGASNRGIDEIRQLRDTVNYAPATSRFKVYIIDEVHMLTKEAFNALLKTLEEPPAHVKFMFATTEPEKVLPTILSRCQRFDLRRIPAKLIVQHLAEIAGKERVSIDEQALFAVARGADGGMRDAESTLDQLISFCGSEIAESDVLSMFGMAGRAQVMELAGHILNANAGGALHMLSQLVENGKDLSRLLSDLLGHVRNLMIYQTLKGDLGMLEVSEAEARCLAEQSAIAPVSALTQVLEVLSLSEGRMREAVSKRIFLEVALLRAIEARQSVALDTVLKKLRELRESDKGSATPSKALPAEVIPAQSATPSHSPQPVSRAESSGAVLRETPPPPRAVEATPTPATIIASAPPPQAPSESLTPPPPAARDLEQVWGEIVESVGRASPFARSYLMEAHPVALSHTLLVVGFDPTVKDHMALVDTPRTRSLIQAKLAELGMKEMALRFVEAEAPAGRRKPAPAAEPAPAAAPVADRPARASKKPPEPEAPRVSISKEEFKNDPLIKQALEIFRGQIVEVRA